MLATENLFLLTQHLSDAGFRHALRAQLDSLEASPAYQSWSGTLAEAEPFSLPGGFDAAVLERVRLLQAGRLTVKLNRLDDNLLLTDGVWVDPAIRVFPFSDESQALLAFVRRARLAEQADWVLDLATGCGHSAIAVGRRAVAFDINPRALAYAAANRALNGISGQACGLALNDIRDGLPPALSSGLRGHGLILANMPFGPAPSADALPLTSNGGESGAALQVATYQALADLARSADRGFSFQACLMGLTVGERSTNRWEIVERAVALFGQGCVRWHLLDDEHVFRIDGVRQLGNPAPVAVALPGLASCRLYTPEAGERAAKIAAFADLARRHEAQGNPDIAYGIVEIVCG